MDDGSTDRTRKIAENFEGVTVISAASAACRLDGKNNAVIAGASAANGRVAALHRRRHNASPGFTRSRSRGSENRGSRFAVLLARASRYRPRRAQRHAGRFSPNWRHNILRLACAISNSGIVAANGQYILVTREAYDAVGGHAAVAGEILEDVALAKALRRAGFRIFLPLRRGCRPRPHVSQLGRTSRRMDEKSGVAISAPMRWRSASSILAVWWLRSRVLRRWWSQRSRCYLAHSPRSTSCLCEHAACNVSRCAASFPTCSSVPIQAPTHV